MTRYHANRPAWEAVDRLVGRYIEDEREDYESLDTAYRDGHAYESWTELARWAKSDQEAASRGYNGWSNYETWAVALWLDNVEHSYRYWREAARECWRSANHHPHTRDGACSAAATARRLLADRLKSEVESSAPDLGATLYADLLGAALDAVDWDEVADGYLTDAAE